MAFNLFAQLNKELDEFFRSKVHIAGTNSGEVRNLTAKTKSYEFSQWETLNTIDLYYNSKFESGETDTEGQRKVFLNICNFRADVASKQVDLDVKDFVFVPEEEGSEKLAEFMTRRFRQWAKRNYFGKLINEVVIDYPKYGTAVLKRVGKELVRVPLNVLRNQQDAKSLKTARYVIEEHKDMALDEMQAMKEWDLKGLEMSWGEKATVYERYGNVPLSWFKEQKDEKIEDGDDTKSIYVMAIIVPKKADKKTNDGTILFLEEAECPYLEAHWKQIDGRWLGIGEIENQFENQIFKNMVANMRRRSLLWSSKKIFQSADENVARNLVKNVKDGEVIKIMPNGMISQVNMSTQAVAEYQSAEQDIEANANQKSFTFEVATGEALPSGTPFRLGVVLSNAVNSHFALKRENLGLFFEEVIWDLVVPIFKKENRAEHTLRIVADEEGVQKLKEDLINLQTTIIAKEELLSGRLPDIEAIKASVTQEIEARKNLFIKMPEKVYEEARVGVQLVTVGEGYNIEKRIETYTNLYNSLRQANDPRAEMALRRLLALTGERADALGGVNQQAQPMANPTQQMGAAVGMPVPQPQAV